MSSTNSTWHRVDAAFQRALEQDGDRRAWVNAEYADDPELCREVLALLDSAEQGEVAFEHLVAERDRLVDEAMSDEPASGAGLVGSRIGNFEVTERIASGGMGVVYKAERVDEQWQQTVAIKILPSWAGDEQTMARLRAERQILSRLQHPNIPPLLDGGETEDGYPYFVSEFIDGEDITNYVQQHELPVDKRLDLFVAVADAVHHAHTKLVIHRDIKPSNILVDQSGRPHLLDFGIAKPLEDAEGTASELTVQGFTPMTLKYASPEQLAGEAVSTASDIYQLGLLLYRLVTGNDARSGGYTTVAMQRGHAGQSARSLIDNLPAGALGTIIDKALRPEPEERYASAAALAADLRAWLRGDAIIARPETTWQAIRRLARRNPALAGAAGLVLVILAGWLVSLQVYSSELERERDYAQTQAVRAERVKDALTDIFRRQDPMQSGSVAERPTSMIESLDIAVATTVQELDGEPDIQAELYRLYSTLYVGAGDTNKAIDMLERASALLQPLGSDMLPVLAETEAELGFLLQNTNGELSLQHYASALAAIPMIRDTHPESAVAVLLSAASGTTSVGGRSDALDHFEQGLALYESSGIDAPGLLVSLLYGYGSSLVSDDRLDEAEPLLLRALSVSEAEFGPEHARIAGVLDALSSLERNRSNLDSAIRYSNRVVAIMRRDRAENFDALLSARNNLALALGKARRFDESVAMLEDLVATYREKNPDTGSAELAKTTKNLASILHMAGRYDEAMPHAEDALELMQRHLPGNSPYQATPWFTMALIHLDSGRPAEGEIAAARSLEILTPLLGENHYQVHVNRCVLGEAMIAQGRIDEGRSLVQPALENLLKAETRVSRYETRCAATARRT